MIVEERRDNGWNREQVKERAGEQRTGGRVSWSDSLKSHKKGRNSNNNTQNVLIESEGKS